MAPRIAARTPPASCHRSTSARAANNAADEGSTRERQQPAARRHGGRAGRACACVRRPRPGDAGCVRLGDRRACHPLARATGAGLAQPVGDDQCRSTGAPSGGGGLGGPAWPGHRQPGGAGHRRTVRGGSGPRWIGTATNPGDARRWKASHAGSLTGTRAGWPSGRRGQHACRGRINRRLVPIAGAMGLGSRACMRDAPPAILMAHEARTTRGSRVDAWRKH